MVTPNANPNAISITYNGGVEHLVVGNFGEINKGFKQFIAETAILAGSQSDTGNMTPANWTDVGKKDAVKLIKK